MTNQGCFRYRTPARSCSSRAPSVSQSSCGSIEPAGESAILGRRCLQQLVVVTRGHERRLRSGRTPQQNSRSVAPRFCPWHPFQADVPPVSRHVSALVARRSHRVQLSSRASASVVRAEREQRWDRELLLKTNFRQARYRGPATEAHLRQHRSADRRRHLGSAPGGKPERYPVVARGRRALRHARPTDGGWRHLERDRRLRVYVESFPGQDSSGRFRRRAASSRSGDDGTELFYMAPIRR